MINPKPKSTKSETHFAEAETRDNILEELPIGICRVDLKGTVKYINKYFEEATGYSRAEIVDRNVLKLDLFPADMRSYIMKRITARIAGAPSKKWDTQFKCKDGTWIWVNLEGSIIWKSKVPVGFQIVASDITERKRAEEALRESEKKYKHLSSELEAILDHLPALIFYKDNKGNFIRVNKYIADAHNMLKEELENKSTFDLYPKDQAQFYLEDDLAVIENNEPKLFIEEPWETEKGKRWVSTSKIPFVDEHGDILGIIGISIDITERKQAEETRRETEEIFNQFMTASPELVYIKDEKHRFYKLSKSFEDLFGKPVSELIGKDLYDLLPPELAEIVYEDDQKVLQGGIEVSSEERLNERVFSSIKFPIHRESGKPDYLGGYSIDITEHKRAEDALKESERLYRSLFENMLNGFAYCQMHVDDQDRPIDFTYLAVNSAFETQTGLRNVTGKKVSEIIPGFREADPELLNIYGRVAKGGQSECFEMFVESLQMWFSVSVYSPKHRYFVSVFDVITDRKRAEEALRESEKNYRELIDGMNETVWVIDFDGNLIDVNKTAVETLGYSKEELLKAGLYDIDSSLKKEDIKALAKSMPSDELQIFETSHKTKDGRSFPVEVYSSLVIYHGKHAILSIVRDITERKRAEEALKENEAKYRLLVESSRDAIVISQNDRFIFINDAFASMLGYQKEELLESSFKKVYTEKAIKLLEERDKQRSIGTEVADRYETVFKKKDGTEVPVEANVRIIDYKEQKATFAVIRDISEQKEILAAIKASAGQSNGLKNHIPICAGCNKIRDDEHELHPWVSPAVYINDRLPDINFTHGMCPDCMKKWYPDYVAIKDTDDKVS